MHEPDIQALSDTEQVYRYKQFFQPVLVEESDRYSTEEYPHCYYVKIDIAKGAEPSVGGSGHPYYNFAFDLKTKGGRYQNNIFKNTSRFYHQGNLFEVVDLLEDKEVDDRFQYYQVKAVQVG